jgi:D-alanine---D-serine ligase
MPITTVAILFGGCSPEYEVSLQSAHSVLCSLDPRRFSPVLIGITRHGDWFRYFGPASGISTDVWHQDPSLCVPALVSPDRSRPSLIELYGENYRRTPFDLAFPVLHGKNGEDGTLQGLFEAADIPYVGCGMLSSALCMDKDRAHEAVRLTGIRTPRSVVITRRDAPEQILNRIGHLTFPLFVKPARAGSSFGISRPAGEAELMGCVHEAFRYDDRVLLEESIPGFEVGCAILGNDALTIGDLDEIELKGGFFDYTEKYTLQTARIHVPARIDASAAKRIKAAAVSIYKTLGCRGFARVDLFLTPENEIVFNEVNTIPGLTLHNRYPNMMKGAGLQLSDIVEKLILLGMNDENRDS